MPEKCREELTKMQERYGDMFNPAHYPNEMKVCWCGRLVRSVLVGAAWTWQHPDVAKNIITM